MAVKRKKKSRKPANIGGIVGYGVGALGLSGLANLAANKIIDLEYQKGRKLTPYDEKRGAALVKGNIKKRRQKDVRRLLDSAAGTKDTGAKRKKQSRAVRIMGNILKDRKK